MRQLIGLSVVAMLASLGAATSAHADSDGYYCVGPNYLAYQLSLRPETTGHFLYVVSLKDSAAIGQPSKIPLPQVQVHGMRCNAASVQVLGWDSLYTVNLSGPKPTVVAEVAPWAQPGASRQQPAGYAQLNLGAWSRAAKDGRTETVAVSVQSTSYRFFLSIDVRATPGTCRSRVVTNLVQVDGTSRVVATLKLFDGEAARECGN